LNHIIKDYGKGDREKIVNAIIRIKKAFDKNDITVPFPIRTLDFGIKGGKTLKEMMP